MTVIKFETSDDVFLASRLVYSKLYLTVRGKCVRQVSFCLKFFGGDQNVLLEI